MDRIKNLNGYQKGILSLLSVMLAGFTVAYFVVSSRVGFAYRDTILLLRNEGENTVYAGRIQGTDAVFTVTPDKTVTFSYGNKSYGPYTAKEDPTAVPEDPISELMIGVELRQGDEIFFRGGVLPNGGNNGHMMLFDENGSFAGLNVYVTTTNGKVFDSEGNEIDQMAPSPSTILNLMDGPELTSKGEWTAWFFGVFLSMITAVLILFADEIFRWNLSFRIRDAYGAEPSEWEIADRYISWTILPIAVLVIYIIGLSV